MGRKLTRRAALGLIGGGAVISVADTRSFSQLTAGREMSVSTADDPNALLGLDGVTASDTIPTFTNQADVPMSVTLTSPNSSAEFDVGNTGTFTSNPAPFDLAVGETVEVGVTGGSESVPVDVEAELQRNGDAVGSIELQRDFAVSQAGQIEVTPDVKSAGNSGKYEFGLVNSGDVDVTIEAISIVETSNPDASVVHDKKILTVNGLQVRSDSIYVGGGFAALDPHVDLNTTDSEKIFEFDRFDAGMKNQDVKIRLKFTDNSTLLVDLCLNSCDF